MLVLNTARGIGSAVPQSFSPRIFLLVDLVPLPVSTLHPHLQCHVDPAVEATLVKLPFIKICMWRGGGGGGVVAIYAPTTTLTGTITTTTTDTAAAAGCANLVMNHAGGRGWIAGRRISFMFSYRGGTPHT